MSEVDSNHQIWSLNQELNPKPIPYEGIALPIVLLRRGAANRARPHNLFHTKELHHQLCYRSIEIGPSGWSCTNVYGLIRLVLELLRDTRISLTVVILG